MVENSEARKRIPPSFSEFSCLVALPRGTNAPPPKRQFRERQIQRHLPP